MSVSQINSLLLICYSLSLVPFKSILAFSWDWSSGIIFLIDFSWCLYRFNDSKCFTYIPHCYSIFFVCISNAFPKGEYVNLACTIVPLSSGSTASLTYWYLFVLRNENPDIFKASLLESYRIFHANFYKSIIMRNYELWSMNKYLMSDEWMNATCWSNKYFHNKVMWAIWF